MPCPIRNAQQRLGRRRRSLVRVVRNKFVAGLIILVPIAITAQVRTELSRRGAVARRTGAARRQRIHKSRRIKARRGRCSLYRGQCHFRHGWAAHESGQVPQMETNGEQTFPWVARQCIRFSKRGDAYFFGSPTGIRWIPGSSIRASIASGAAGSPPDRLTHPSSVTRTTSSMRHPMPWSVR